MFRQQLKERKEAQSLKVESLDEVRVVPRNILLRYFYNCFGTRYRDMFLQHSFLLLIFLYSSRRKSTVTSGSDANFRSEGLAGEILDPLLLLYVLCHQFLWKGVYKLFKIISGESFMG